jgi:hypothetical protein
MWEKKMSGTSTYGRHRSIFLSRIFLSSYSTPAAVVAVANVFGIGDLLRCVGAFAIIGRWGASPTVVVSHLHPTGCSESHRGY